MNEAMPDDLQEQQDQNYLSPRQLLLGLRKLIAQRKASRYERLQQKKRSKAIDQALQEDWKRSSRQCSILLLGVDHSSRSELIEIVKTYSQGNYTAEELVGYRLSVYKSLVDFAKALIDAMEQFGILPEKQENLAGCTYLKEFTVDPDPSKPFEPKASVAINALWKDPCIARVLEHSEVNALPRSAL
jgi:guanine nucleotide-binding protein subunit alpha